MTDTVLAQRDLTASDVRDVTDEEIATYHADGWVRLNGLLSPELTAELLRIARARKDGGMGFLVSGGAFWGEANLATSGEHEVAASVALGAQMGRNAHRLIGRSQLTDREISTQYFSDSFSCKPPQAAGTPYHQDFAERAQDRGGALTFWIALDHVRSDQGGMQFLEGSHQQGQLGSLYFDGDKPADGTDVLGRYPKLAELHPPTAPLEYEPGDATVHSTYLVHGAPPNESATERWSYLASYFPSDALYDGAPNHFATPLGLERGMPFKGLPVVYP
jgi:hypothetical protein